MAVALAVIYLYGQQSDLAKRTPPAPGTIPALIADPAQQGDIKLVRNVDFAEIPTIDSLADRSDAVVLGRIVASRAFPCDQLTFVCTEFRFKVRQVIWGSVPADRRGKDHIGVTLDKNGKPATESTPSAERVIQYPGPALDEIVVAQFGGVLKTNRRRVIANVADQVPLRPGREYVLFVKWIPDSSPTRSGSQVYQICGGNQAEFEVSDNQLRPLVTDPTHPVLADLEGTFGANLLRLISHFQQRRNAQ